MDTSFLIILIYPLLISLGITSSYIIQFQDLSKIYSPKACLKLLR